MIAAACALLLVAVVFVLAELFVPSHGAMALFAAVAAVASVIMAYQVSVPVAAVFAILIVISTPVAFFVAIKIYPTTAVGRRVILAEPPAGNTESFTAEMAQLSSLVGQQGVAITTLRPAGSIEIQGQRINAISESEVIDAGAAVEIMQVSGLKVFVKRVG